MIAIIDYEAGNIRSLLNALGRIGATAELTSDAEVIRRADHVIFPGVGEASSAMERLRRLQLDRLIPTLTQPFLGICIGLQLMCRHSEENDTEGIGIFDARVKRFPAGLKVPQVGWNNIRRLESPLFQGVPEETDCYFVHGYYAEVTADTIAEAEYSCPFSAALHKNNFYAVQFHPEISSNTGESVLKNFLAL